MSSCRGCSDCKHSYAAFCLTLPLLETSANAPLPPVQHELQQPLEVLLMQRVTTLAGAQPLHTHRVSRDGQHRLEMGSGGWSTTAPATHRQCSTAPFSIDWPAPPALLPA